MDAETESQREETEDTLSVKADMGNSHSNPNPCRSPTLDTCIQPKINNTEHSTISASESSEEIICNPTQKVALSDPTQKVALSDPTHNGPLSDPTHNGPLSDPTHNGPLSDPTHNGPLSDLTHNDPVSDPGPVSDPTRNGPVSDPTHNGPLSDPTHNNDNGPAIISDPTHNGPLSNPTQNDPLSDQIQNDTLSDQIQNGPTANGSVKGHGQICPLSNRSQNGSMNDQDANIKVNPPAQNNLMASDQAENCTQNDMIESNPVKDLVENGPVNDVGENIPSVEPTLNDPTQGDLNENPSMSVDLPSANSVARLKDQNEFEVNLLQEPTDIAVLEPHSSNLPKAVSRFSRVRRSARSRSNSADRSVPSRKSSRQSSCDSDSCSTQVPPNEETPLSKSFSLQTRSSPNLRRKSGRKARESPDSDTPSEMSDTNKVTQANINTPCVTEDESTDTNIGNKESPLSAVTGDSPLSGSVSGDKMSVKQLVVTAEVATNADTATSTPADPGTDSSINPKPLGLSGHENTASSTASKVMRLSLGTSKGDKSVGKKVAANKNSARKTISRKPAAVDKSRPQGESMATDSPPSKCTPPKKMEDILKGSSGKKLQSSQSKKLAGVSPDTKPKKLVSPSSEGKLHIKGARGPRAKMSLSPNRLSTITIEDYFKPIPSDKMATKTARKTLAYSPKKPKDTKHPKKMEQVQPSKSPAVKVSKKTPPSGENMISRDAASKALSALQTESPTTKKTSENSDVENNPAIVSSKVSGKELRMPKAKKSFPRSKKSSVTEIFEKFKSDSSPQTNTVMSSDQKIPVSNLTLSPSASSGHMTFKLKELESAFGIKRKLIGKMDAKTLDQLVLERTQECKVKKQPTAKRTRAKRTPRTPANFPKGEIHVKPEPEEDPSSTSNVEKSSLSNTTGWSVNMDCEPSTNVQSLQPEVNFASLLTSQKILKKRSRRRMGRYNLPGQKRRKKPTTAKTNPKKQGTTDASLPSAELASTHSQPHQSPGLKLKICASREAGHFTVSDATACTSPDQKTWAENLSPKATDLLGSPVPEEGHNHVTDTCQGNSSDTILRPQTTTRRSRIRRKTSKRRRNWALGRIPKQNRSKQPRAQKISGSEPGVTLEVLGSEPGVTQEVLGSEAGVTQEGCDMDPASLDHTEVTCDSAKQVSSSKSPQAANADPVFGAPSPKCGKKRKWTTNDGDDSVSDISMVTNPTDPDLSNVSSDTQGSKRKKPVELENDNIPFLSLATTPLPIITRGSVVHSQPPKITPQKVLPSSECGVSQQISVTRGPPQLSPMKVSGISLLKPSPRRSKMEKSSVHLGAVPKDIKYRIEGAHGVNNSECEDSVYKFHNTPNGITYPVTPPSTPEHASLSPSENSSVISESPESVEVKGSDKAPDHIPLCCCKMKGLPFTKLLPGHKHPIYCQALDSVNGKITGCCNKATQPQMVRAARKVPFMAVCEVHRHRMRMHQCCPGCGQFCTEGDFLQCRTEKQEGSKKVTILHHFHRQCQVYKANKYYCPHCAQESKQYQVHLKLNGPPTSWTELRDPAPLSCTELTGGAGTASQDTASQLAVAGERTLHDDKPNGLPGTSALGSERDLKTSSPGTSPSDVADGSGRPESGTVSGPRSVHSRSARMCPNRRPSLADGNDQIMAAVAMEVPATDKLVSSKSLPLGPSRTELENAIMILDGDRAKKLRAGAKNLFKACRVGDTEKVVLMLADGADPNMRFEDEENQSPLHAAATSGYHLLVHVLLQAGANPHAIDNRLRTPLMEASEQGHLQTLRILIKAGSLIDAKGSDGMSSIHLAAQSGKVDAVKYLLQTKRTGVNVKDDGGWTPLIWAAEYSHLDVVHYLLQMGADPNIRDNEGNTALHWAAFSGSVDIAEIFLNAGCDMETVNELGDRPLHISARQDHYQIVVLLLARGADSEARNNDNEAPIGCCSDKDTPVWMALRVNKQLKGFAAKKLHRSDRLLHSSSFLYRDISYGRELNAMPVVNAVDDENYPTDFLYVTDNVETSPMNVNRLLSSLQACKCRETCGSVFCQCSVSSVKCWYEKDGRLVKDFSFSDPPLIFECNKACRCWSTCPNRVVQLGVTCRLQVFRTSGRGWGARTLLDIPKGNFVCEYIGELISDAEADSREDDSYLFDLDNKDADTFCIDARRYGNVSRFVNHLCEPNLVPVKVFVDHQDLRFPRICFFASRDIKAYEELGFDYGEKFWIIKWKQFTCTCGSTRCRYSSETIHKTLEEYNRRQEEEVDQEP